jgi:mono/diheme cytochrome c family protein
MRPVLKAAALLIALGAVIATIGLIYLMNTGLSARDTPGALETALALRVRNLTIGWHANNIKNPTQATPEALAEARAHFADHCAACHANNGSGDTDFGRGMFPKPPDMRLPRTQELTDGELFYIIENGIRFTGMPAFGTGNPTAESSTWPLVQFIRHLPQITAQELEEMERLNPAPPAEIERRLQEEQFLQGGGNTAPAMPPMPSMPPHKGGHK